MTYLELVETQDISIRSKLSCNGLNRVTTTMSKSLSGGVYPFVNVDHERMEMHATLSGDVRGEGCVEEIHEHRLSGTYVAVQVKPLGHLLQCGGTVYRP